MSMLKQFEAIQNRALQDQSLAKADAPDVAILKPEDDVELQAALAKVAAGQLVAAFRTRNGVLVETKGTGPLHRLQKTDDQ
jgi:hypothetical protein